MRKAAVSIDITENKGVCCALGVANISEYKMSVYSFFVDGVLIDTGAISMLDEFIPYFKSQSIERVVMTHYHEDHVGGAKWIQDHLKVPLYINASSVKKCQQPFTYPMYRQLGWGLAQPFRANALESSFTSFNETWDVLDTPGHSADHVSFYNRDRKILFSVDLFVQVRTKVILKEENIRQTMNSLEKVLEYNFEEVYCNHAGYLPNGHKLLQDKLEYLKQLEEQIFQLYEKGMNVHEITNALFPKKYPIVSVSNGEWDSMHIVTSMLSGN